MKYLNRISFFVLIFTILTLSCGPASFELQNADKPGPGNQDGQDDNDDGNDDSDGQDGGERFDKIFDVLFVLDTSFSLRHERQKISDQAQALLDTFPSDSNYRIGVLLAHGSKSAHSGRLFTSKKNEPTVLSSESHTADEIKDGLSKKFKYVRKDHFADGGEEGVFSLNQALEGENLVYNQSQGFFRAKAALAVVFISDENDICTEYNNSFIERRAFRRDCADISTAGTWQKLTNLRNPHSVYVSAIVYNNEATLPTDSSNDMGHGYLELVQLAGGISVDLASPDFHQGLTDIGNLTVSTIQLMSQFRLNHDQIDPATVSVRVDGQPETGYRLSGNIVILENAGNPDSKIDVNYCLDLP
jgi:hypothetical protein